MKPGGQAVVIGASVAGLLAARALSPFFETVTVLDRDTLPLSPVPRRGVPQGRHVHALAARGAAGLEALFPGFLDDLAVAGVPHGDAQGDAVWYLDGHRMAHGTVGLPLYLVTRPLLEHLIRQRVRDLPNVVLHPEVEATGVIVAGGRVTGVQAGRPLPADLVVDAAGRGSRVPAWLGRLGYPPPEETTIRENRVYVTRHFEADPDLLDGKLMVGSTSYPGVPRSGSAVRQEGDRIAVMITGRAGEQPPTDDDGMIAYATTLAAPQIAEVLRTAKPLDRPTTMRYSQSSLRHFEKLVEGYLVVGDALCSLNPTYGQGQAIAVLEAELIVSLLSTGHGDLASRYFHQVATLLAEPWALTAGRPDQAAGGYLTRLRAATATDPDLSGAFLRVANMAAPIASLFTPDVRRRVPPAP
ncbi:squalene monooxygenase [Actinoplanes sp. TBRC 11911]|uniref:FAD-dependent oxidoreductase n=1 Tax=Actinoplanes sp. TBRC 11911 TaxID=2729386 RepID=UPI00145C535E|nr:squalene monooxygenase [Actinoplanes sp. TBRC 11911]NMO55706.1 squalene monooxygenase [Actinoplanes sp. TBRC 11911]